MPIIFLIHPIFEKGGYETYTIADLHKKLSDEASKNNLIVYDILEEYRRYDVDTIKQHPVDWNDPWHPNAKGHKIIADYLYKKMVLLGIVDS